MKTMKLLGGTLAAALLAGPAFAHTGHGATSGLAAGLFHGHAHALEANGSQFAYVTGFVLATSAVHGVGAFFGWRLASLRCATPAVGGAVALAALPLIAG